MMVVKVRVNNTMPGRNPPLCCTLTLHQSPCRDTRQKQNIFFRVHNKGGVFYYERSELLIDGDGQKTTQKIVRRRQPRCNYRPIIFFKTTVRTVLFFRTASCVAWTRIMCSVLSTLTLATCEQRSHLLRNVHNCNNITASLPQTEPASLLQTEPASLLQTVPAPCRAADASPGRLNDSNASPCGERQPARGLLHGDSCGANNKLQQLMLCSSKSMSASLFSIRRSLSNRMSGPWWRCRRTSSRSYGRCGTSAVSCGWSGGARMGSAPIPLST